MLEEVMAGKEEEQMLVESAGCEAGRCAGSAVDQILGGRKRQGRVSTGHTEQVRIWCQGSCSRVFVAKGRDGRIHGKATLRLASLHA